MKDLTTRKTEDLNSSFDQVLEARKINLHQSMVRVMQEVKNIDKAMTVGSGNYSYKGVADKDVKQLIGQSMAANGLTCVPIEIKPTVTINTWEEEYNGKTKQKQSVFTEILAKYRITHADTGETIDIVGYGHGQDTMDKSAGKATTYALKNALLYSFLVPTGAIDDTDKSHSKEVEQPQKKTLDAKVFANVLQAVKEGKYTKQKIKNSYALEPKQVIELDKL